MAGPKRVATLEVSQNFPYQKKFWKIERAGWVVFLLLLVLAGLGFTGGITIIPKEPDRTASAAKASKQKR